MLAKFVFKDVDDCNNPRRMYLIHHAQKHTFSISVILFRKREIADRSLAKGQIKSLVSNLLIITDKPFLGATRSLQSTLIVSMTLEKIDNTICCFFWFVVRDQMATVVEHEQFRVR